MTNNRKKSDLLNKNLYLRDRINDGICNYGNGACSWDKLCGNCAEIQLNG